MQIKKYRLSKHYESVEQFFGVACPLLSALSILDYFGLLRWAWLFLFWLSCGHWSLYFYGLYPVLKYRAFVKGLFIFGVGLLWPIWCALQLRNRRWG